jgi:beta-glucanase (GH16 family)
MGIFGAHRAGSHRIRVARRAAVELLEGRALRSGVYHLTMDDEFNTLKLSNYTSSGALVDNTPANSGWLTRDQNDWTGYDPTSDGYTHYANPAIEAYNPFSINNGVLSISAEPTPVGMQGMGPGQTVAKYVSGELTSAQGGQAFNTSNGFSQQYGYFEMKCQAPSGPGMWPAFWMLPEPNLNTSKTNAEYDIFEIPVNADPSQNQNTQTIYQTSHFNGSSQQVAYHLPSGEDASTAFHTYGFEWDATNIRWYVDGKLTATMANQCNTPMYLLMDLYVGGDWPGQPNGSTAFPASFKIDYVRAYSCDDDVPAVVPQEGYSVSPDTLSAIPVPEPSALQALMLALMYAGSGRLPRRRTSRPRRDENKPAPAL